MAGEVPEGHDDLEGGGRPQQDGARPFGHGATAQREAGDGDHGKRPGRDRGRPDGAVGLVAQGEPQPVGGVGDGGTSQTESGGLSAYSPNGETVPRRRARRPSARSRPTASTPETRPAPPGRAGRLARSSVMASAAARRPRPSSSPRCRTHMAQLVATQRPPGRLPAAGTYRAACRTVSSARARGRRAAWNTDRRAARPRKRTRAAGARRPSRTSPSSAFVAARLSVVSAVVPAIISATDRTLLRPPRPDDPQAKGRTGEKQVESAMKRKEASGMERSGR